MNDFISYDVALEKVETWVEKSGIREICVDICKGKCCTKKSEETKCTACLNSNEKNIMCSLFICSPLKQVLKLTENHRYILGDNLRYLLYIHNMEYYKIFTKKEKENFIFKESHIKLPNINIINKKHKKEVKELINKGYWV